MKMNIFLLILLIFVGYANAEEIKPVDDQEKAWLLLSGVAILMDKKDIDEIPAIVRAVTVPVRLEKCELSLVTEDGCPQKELYLVFSNWDIVADLYAFRIGLAEDWRVGKLVLQEKNRGSWTAILTLEADKHVYGKVTTEKLKIKIMNTVNEQYVLNFVND